MSTLNLTAIKQGLKQKSTEQLITILSFTQDDYDREVIPVIREILIERGTSQSEIDDYNVHYTNLKNSLKNQTKLNISASFINRVCQYLIDHFLFIGICYLIQFYLSEHGNLKSPTYESYCVMAYFLYYFITIGFFKATIGMLLIGLKVVETDNSKINAGHGIWRSMCMLLNYFTLQLGHFWMLFDKKKRTLVDIWSNTKVVYSK